MRPPLKARGGRIPGIRPTSSAAGQDAAQAEHHRITNGRHEERAYREYSTDEQRRGPGCVGGRMRPYLCTGPLKCSAASLVGISYRPATRGPS
jgi:hypothetical protein